MFFYTETKKNIKYIITFDFFNFQKKYTMSKAFLFSFFMFCFSSFLSAQYGVEWSIRGNYYYPLTNVEFKKPIDNIRTNGGNRGINRRINYYTDFEQKFGISLMGQGKKESPRE